MPSKLPRPRAPTCFLERNDREPDKPLQPAGVTGWEVSLPEDLQQALAAVIPDGGSGRDLFVTEHSDVLLDWTAAQRPPPTTPLLLRATHRSLRALCAGTPAEAQDLGQRLALLCAVDFRAVTTTECPPAVVAELLRRYVYAALGPSPAPTPRIVTIFGREAALRWVTPWSREQIFAGRPAALLLPGEKGGLVVDLSEARGEAGPQDYGLFALRSYADGRPTTLAPVTLTLESPGVAREVLAQVLQDQAVMGQPFADCTYSTTALRITPTEISLLMPLRADNWHAHLSGLRDNLHQLLGIRVGYSTMMRDDFLDLVKNLEALREQLFGAEALEDAEPAPPQGPRPPVGQVAAVLALLMESLGVRFEVEPLLRTAAEHDAARPRQPIARA